MLDLQVDEHLLVVAGSSRNQTGPGAPASPADQVATGAVPGQMTSAEQRLLNAVQRPEAAARHIW